MRHERRLRALDARCLGLGASLGVVLGSGVASAAGSEATAPNGANAALTWADVTASPSTLGVLPGDPLERETLSRCGTGDAGLELVARAVAARRARELPGLDADALATVQRAAGEPHPWARAWSASTRSSGGDEVLRALDRWLDDGRDKQLRRCGVASALAHDGSRVVAVVAVDAFADLAPLPVRGRTGQWLSIDARLHVAASGGHVFVVGPGGAPRRLPTWFDGRSLHARFALDAPGEFAVQVVATTSAGPRPVIEATVFADVEPTAAPQDAPAPGEDADGGGTDDLLLARMLAGARSFAGERRLARDVRLDGVALRHARTMAAVHEVAHDAGDGDPTARLQAAGLDARASGENVARAATVALAHRALWASPAHRANMLERDFDAVGLAVVRDDEGQAWVVETFTRGLAP